MLDKHLRIHEDNKLCTGFNGSKLVDSRKLSIPQLQVITPPNAKNNKKSTEDKEQVSQMRSQLSNKLNAYWSSIDMTVSKSSAAFA